MFVGTEGDRNLYHADALFILQYTHRLWTPGTAGKPASAAPLPREASSTADWSKRGGDKPLVTPAKGTMRSGGWGTVHRPSGPSFGHLCGNSCLAGWCVRGMPWGKTMRLGPPNSCNPAQEVLLHSAPGPITECLPLGEKAVNGCSLARERREKESVREPTEMGLDHLMRARG